jgi:hypothetical protein
VHPDARAESAISTLRGEGKGLFNVYKRRSSHPEDEGVHFEYKEGETRNAQGPSMASLTIWHPPKGRRIGKPDFDTVQLPCSKREV